MAKLTKQPPQLDNTVSEQEAKADAIFYSIGDGAIVVDEFGRITKVNPAARRILGYSKQELIGKWFPKKVTMVDASDQPLNLIDRPISRAVLTGQPISEKAFYRHKKGHKIPVAITVSPIVVGGKPIGAVEVFRDISFEEEVDRMKSEFISLASHQLRTPLSAVKTYSHMLIDGYMGEITPAQRDSLATIVNAANRMNELISTLLNITKIESGTIAIRLGLINIEKAVREVIKELSLQAVSKSIKLSLKVSGEASKIIRTDKLILKEVLTNVMSNAIKYTPDGGSVKTTIKLRDDDVMISVKDTGWGIPKYSQDQIFSKFFRAHNIVKRETSGTGLGLYLVKGLIDTIGGKIWFKSQEGSGTQFYITLPRRPKTEPSQTKNKK